MKEVLSFTYTGIIPDAMFIRDIQKQSELFNFPVLTMICEDLLLKRSQRLVQYYSSSTLTSHLHHLLVSGEYSDIIVHVEDKTFHLHKVILVRSPFLKKMIEKEGTVNVEGITKHAFTLVLEYLYVNGLQSASLLSHSELILLYPICFHDLPLENVMASLEMPSQFPKEDRENKLLLHIRSI